MAGNRGLMGFAADTLHDRSGRRVKSPIWDKGGQVHNVRAYGAQGDGSADDTSAIQAAIDAVEAAGGGQVFIPVGSYRISATLTITVSSVGLAGAGHSYHPNNANAAIWNPATELLWYGNTTTPLIKVNYGADGNPVNGITLRDFGLNLRESCMTGVELVATQGSHFANIGIKNGSSGTLACTAWHLHALAAEAAATIDVSRCTFENLWAGVVSTFMKLEGSDNFLSNVSNSTFVNLFGNFGLNSSSADGIHITDGDNNRFFGLQLTRASGGTGYGVRLGPRARGNYLYGFGGNAGLIAETPAVTTTPPKGNAVFGYDRENGQPAPVIQAGAALSWTEDGTNSTNGWTAARVGGRLNVKSFGARGDCVRVTDGAMTASSATLTCSTSAPFASTDVGKLVVVYFSGRATVLSGAGVNGQPLVTTISGFTSSSVVTLASAATVTVSGATVVFGSDDTAAIQSVINLLRTTPGEIYLPPGMYGITSTLKLQPLTNTTDFQGIKITGDGFSVDYNNANLAPWRPATELAWLSATGDAFIRCGNKPGVGMSLSGQETDCYPTGGFVLSGIGLEGNFLATGGIHGDRVMHTVYQQLGVHNLAPSGKYRATVKTSTVANPSDTPTINTTAGGTAGGGLPTGNYWLMYALEDAAGESLPSPESALFNIPALATPAAPTAVASGTGGTIPTGNYLIACSYINASGETVPSADTAAVAVTLGQIVTVTLPANSSGATGKNVYCTTAGGATGTKTRQNGSTAVTGTSYVWTSLKAGSPFLAATSAGDGRIPRVTHTAAPADSYARIYLTPENGRPNGEVRYPATHVSTSTRDLLDPPLFNWSATGLALYTVQPAANENAENVTVRDYYANSVPCGINLSGSRAHTANVSHCLFDRIMIAHQGNGIDIDDSDNVCFVNTWIFSNASDTSGYGVRIGSYARSTYWFHLEPGTQGLFADSPSNTTQANTIIGYDRSNNQPTPVLFAAPTPLPGISTATTGGSLANATYYYRIEAYDDIGNRIGILPEVSIATTGSNVSTVTLTWTAVSGASYYWIFRGTSAGGENVQYTDTASPFTDTGAAGGAFAPNLSQVTRAIMTWSEDSNNGSGWNFGTKLNLCPATTAGASLNIAGAIGIPSSPAAGDMWVNSTQKHFAFRHGNTNQSWPSVLFTSTASVSSTTTAETKSLVGSGIGSMTLGATFMIAGKTLRLRLRGNITTGGTAGTITVFVKFGATTIASTGAVAPTTSQSNKYWECEVDITCRTTGASGTFFVQGTFSYMNATTPAAMITWPVRGNSADPPAAVTVDTTASSLVDFQTTTSNNSHVVTCNLVSLESLN